MGVMFSCFYFKKTFLISLSLGILPSVYCMDSDSRGNRCIENDKNLNRKILSLLSEDYYRKSNTHFSLKQAVRVPTQEVPAEPFPYQEIQQQQNFGNNLEKDNLQNQTRQLPINSTTATQILGYTIFSPNQPQEKNCAIQ